jgi:hypothetical protein
MRFGTAVPTAATRVVRMRMRMRLVRCVVAVVRIVILLLCRRCLRVRRVVRVVRVPRPRLVALVAGRCTGIGRRRRLRVSGKRRPSSWRRRGERLRIRRSRGSRRDTAARR